MAREGLLSVDLLLGEGDPMVDAICALDVVAVVEERVGEAIRLERRVGTPPLVGPKELVTVVEPCGNNALAHGKVNCYTNQCVRRYIDTSRIDNLFSTIRDVNYLIVLNVVSVYPI